MLWYTWQGVYSAGRIILADDGRMIFSDDGEVRIVLDEDSLVDATTASFKGPREEEGFDFNCVKNVRGFALLSCTAQPD